MPVFEVPEDGAGPVFVVRVRGGRGGGLDAADIVARARETVRRHGSLRLLVFVERIGMLEAASLRSHLPLAGGLAGHVERVAVVGDQGWLKVALSSAPGSGPQVRLFPPSRVEEARRWVSEPAGD